MGPKPGVRSGGYCGPAPNAYFPSCYGCGLKTSLGQRLKQPKVWPTPGPGQYELPPADLYLPGRFSTGKTIGKRFANGCKQVTPGPGAYDAKAVKCCTRFTFGQRYPDTVPTFSVTADNQHFRCRTPSEPKRVSSWSIKKQLLSQWKLIFFLNTTIYTEMQHYSTLCLILNFHLKKVLPLITNTTYIIIIIIFSVHNQWYYIFYFLFLFTIYIK